MSGAMRITGRRGAALLLAAALTPLFTPALGNDAPIRAIVDPALRAVRGAVNVIVQERVPAGDEAERTVERSGGTVTRQLPIVDGFSATVPAEAIDALARLDSVRVLSADRRVNVFSIGGGSPLKSVYPKAVRATNMWDLGHTGDSVTVALIDTGINDSPDLAGRVMPVTDDVLGTTKPCVNLSGESTCADSYGHGTFLAGIIAGNGASSGGAWTGVAPEAKLVSIKIAGASGAADVSGVLAALQWTVSFKDRYGIKVVNLSLGTDSTQSYRVDPLNYAVERAWAAGIAVVVSASNRGPAPGTISKPGDDPFVITVGAVDDRGTAGIGDDSLPNFSSRGPTAADGIAKPDVVAPGAHMISLRAVGSAVDTNFPNHVDGAYRKGSGTSMSAAVVSGAAALLLDANPSMTPDRLKFALASTARPVASSDPMAVGAGEIDARAALTAPPGIANVGVTRSTGMGSLDASRGTVDVQVGETPTCTVLQGAMTAQLLLWDPVAYITGDWSGASWYGASWYGASWYGASWYGASWYGASWYGASWYGNPDGASWYGASWYGASWYGAWE